MKENVPLFEKIIQLRQEEAEILGFKNHAVRLYPRYHLFFPFLMKSLNSFAGIHTRRSHGQERRDSFRLFGPYGRAP